MPPDSAPDAERSGQRPRRRQGALGVVLIAGVVVAPLAVGTVHEWSRGVVFALSALALLVALWDAWASRRRVAVTVPLVALAVAVAATALQLVPLPAAVLARLSPAADELLSLRGYTSHPISLDPAGTVRELAKLGAYLGFFAAATMYASRSHRRRHLVVAVAAVATLVALIGLAQAALGIHDILGVYAPHAEWAPLVRGTFVNPNHFGALLDLGAPCAMLIALRERRWRVPAFLALFVIDIALILTLERAANVAALFGQALVFVLDWLQLRGGRARVQSPAVVRGTLAVAAVAAVAIGVGFGGSRLEVEVAKTVELDDLHDPHSKLWLWAQSGELVWSYPWTGVGRGAFPQAFTRISDIGGRMRFEWVENGYIEVAVDWGVPVALLLTLLAGWSAVLAARRLADDPLALGAFAGIVALALHEAADFAVELPGVGLPALAVLATLFGRRNAQPDPGLRLVAARPAYLALPLVLLVPFAFELRMPSADADAAELTALARDPGVPVETLIARGDAARARHPADYYLCTVVAERLARELRPESMRWLNEAMYLNPAHPAPHLMAAELLAASGRKAQALIEYRLAAAGASDPRTTVWTRVVARYPGIDDLLAATPNDAGRLHMLGKWLYALNRPADAERVYQMVLERDPGHRAALLILARIAILRRDPQAAAERVHALLEVDQGTTSRWLAIEERLLAGDLGGAVARADRLMDTSRGSFDVELKVDTALARAGRIEEARRRLDRLGRWDLDPQARIELHEARAAIERDAGNESQYRWELEQRDLLRGK